MFAAKTQHLVLRQLSCSRLTSDLGFFWFSYFLGLGITAMRSPYQAFFFFFFLSQQWWHLGAYLFPLCPCMASRLLLRVLVHWRRLLYPLLDKTVHEWLNARLPVQQGYHDFNFIICCHWDPGSFFLPLLLQQLINVHQLLRDPAKYNLCSLASAS